MSLSVLLLRTDKFSIVVAEIIKDYIHQANCTATAPWYYILTANARYNS